MVVEKFQPYLHYHISLSSTIVLYLLSDRYYFPKWVLRKLMVSGSPEAFDTAISSSSSFAFSGSKMYDVFISFRGEDTRNTFTSHLYAALCRRKIKTYIDEESLRKGDEISPALLKAIEESKLAVIVFSQNYASSSWCLDELNHIFKCKGKDKQLLVVPIFYHVDPSHVRKQNGSYGVAFGRHEERFKDKIEIVHQWRVALAEAANLSGWHLTATIG